MSDGKNAVGLTGFPTPNEGTGDSDYLLFYVPDNPSYSQLMLGALKALTAAYNWYRSGDLNEDEAAEALRLIIQQAPYNKLPSCSLPTGEPLERIDPETGNIQNVDEDGNWQNDPSIPPTPERPPATPEEQRCLAAANATAALAALYETVSESFQNGLTIAEAITAFVAAVGTAIALEFYPPAAALIAVGGLLFEIVYQVVEFITSDLWTSEFTSAMQCILYECASVDDDVVTFDFQCVLDRLASQTNAFELTAEQLRLFGQVTYLLGFIGVDGLNYAGSGTGISSASCDCGANCYDVAANIGLFESGWTPAPSFCGGLGADCQVVDGSGMYCSATSSNSMAWWTDLDGSWGTAGAGDKIVKITYELNDDDLIGIGYASDETLTDAIYLGTGSGVNDTEYTIPAGYGVFTRLRCSTGKVTRFCVRNAD